MPRICAHFWVNLPGIISQEKDCVETFNNENDQVDALKRFFAENGKALAVGVILGIGALVGWRYWTSHQQDTARDSRNPTKKFRQFPFRPAGILHT